MHKQILKAEALPIRFHRSHATEASDTLQIWHEARCVLPNTVSLAGWDYKTLLATGAEVMGFENEAAAKPESSLAQKIADHFGIEVHAFLRRSFYGNVLREDFESETIVDVLVAGRKTQGETQVIPISGEHEALPHPGLANKWGRIPKTGIPTPFVGGPKSEGTDNFAIWRKRGGRELPSAADSPTGVGSDMRVFKRTKK